MKKLEVIYPDAVEHTKQKVHHDIIQFLKTKEELPDFHEYLMTRKQYVEQIWINVWVNKANNGTPRYEKKQYLEQRGFEVDGVDKKTINKLFRQEIKGYHPFQIEDWLIQIFSYQETWHELYIQARELYKQELEKQAFEKEKQKLIEEMDDVQKILSNHFSQIYIHIRKKIADKLKLDFQTNLKYQHMDPWRIEERLIPEGSFQPLDYETMGDFFQELTGKIVFDHDQQEYEYEYYFDDYQKYIFDQVYKTAIETVKRQLKNDVFNKYDNKIVDSTLSVMISDESMELCDEIIPLIYDERVSDLLKLADIPFEEQKHEQIWLEDIRLREQRKAEAKAELQRKKEEERRIINEIFAVEYNPSPRKQVRYILHIGETNTGKTYHALQKMMNAESGIYLAPLRLLALEVYDYLNASGVPCSLKTGEEEKIQMGARHISCTVEMFHEKDPYQVVVIDEAQMISDKDRGFSWYKAITKAQAEEVHIIASRNTKDMLVQLLGDVDVEIHEYKRDIPLKVENKEFKLKSVKKGDALICFSRKRVLETASRLQNSGHTVSMIYGSMPPETRKKQVERFNKGEAKIIVATDAIGMGLNLPIQRIVFLENQKFDGTSRRLLKSQEVKQIAGRAGRKGIYDIGKVAFTESIESMKRLLQEDDEPLQTFTIAPTNQIFERFQKYYRDLGMFFDLWDKFKSPKGTKKASLTEEKELYKIIRGSELEARLSIIDLYGLLHLPFSTREPELIKQWKNTVEAIVEKRALPKPKIKKRTLEDLELTYKAIGLHLLFLYRLDERTQSIYWERVREEISDLVHEKLQTEVKTMKKRCRTCNKVLPWDHRFQICESCYRQKYVNDYRYY
ncbi:helicase-related protein [Niallia sp. Krafla_26]|uniref:helicase-related protein n=1 Tax=Niallia sp. Krafla_26 TaxID=3064703 RepID=UPI003D16243D